MNKKILLSATECIQALEACSSRYPFVSMSTHLKNERDQHELHSRLTFLKTIDSEAVDEAWQKAMETE